MSDIKRTSLSNAELAERCHAWITDLCQRRRDWLVRIPADVDNDPDLLWGECLRRIRELEAEVAALRAKQMVACNHIGEHHGDLCKGGRIQSPNAQFTQECPCCKGTGNITATAAKVEQAVREIFELDDCFDGELGVAVKRIIRRIFGVTAKET